MSNSRKVMREYRKTTQPGQWTSYETLWGIMVFCADRKVAKAINHVAALKKGKR